MLVPGSSKSADAAVHSQTSLNHQRDVLSPDAIDHERQLRLEAEALAEFARDCACTTDAREVAQKLAAALLKLCRAEFASVS
jgi:hypothetical protein